MGLNQPRRGFASCIVLIVGIAGCGADTDTNSTTSPSSTTGSGGGGDGGGGTGGSGGMGGSGGNAMPFCGDGIVNNAEQCDEGKANADDAECTAGCKIAKCGDGLVQTNVEACDDGNLDNSDACTMLYKAPACDDGLVSGGESDVDCGASCGVACMLGQVCGTGADCETSGCVGGMCGYASSCAALLAGAPALPSGTYPIDPDGDGPLGPYDVHCDMVTDGGGWTLVIVGSDDGTNTWTSEKRTLLTTDTTLVGSLAELSKDYKSAAHHQVPFTDLLFVHAPSGIWAAYASVGNQGASLADFMAPLPYPNCAINLAGNGYPMTAGTLTVTGKLCDSDLYFHLGDQDGNQGVAYCSNLAANFNNSTYGPSWNVSANDACPFDDPSGASLGPTNKCSDPVCIGVDKVESGGVGFGGAIGVNTGTQGAAQNYLQVFVR